MGPREVEDFLIRLWERPTRNVGLLVIVVIGVVAFNFLAGLGEKLSRIPWKSGAGGPEVGAFDRTRATADFPGVGPEPGTDELGQKEPHAPVLSRQIEGDRANDPSNDKDREHAKGNESSVEQLDECDVYLLEVFQEFENKIYQPGSMGKIYQTFVSTVDGLSDEARRAALRLCPAVIQRAREAKDALSASDQRLQDLRESIVLFNQDRSERSRQHVLSMYNQITDLDRERANRGILARVDIIRTGFPQPTVPKPALPLPDNSPIVK